MGKEAPQNEELEVAVAGEGVTPADLSIRDVAELLDALGAAVEAAAKALMLPVPLVSLAEVRPGSAAYALKAPATPQANAAIRLVYDAARTRGRGQPADLRRALERMHAVGKVGAGVRLTIVGAKPGAPIMLAPLLDIAESVLEETEEVHAHVVGVSVGKAGMNVRLRIEGKRTETFSADEDVAKQAARLFNRRVRARVVFRRSVAVEEAGEIEELELWEDLDFLDAVRAIRQDLSAEGIVLDARDWLGREGE
jgi:hypothetical protein